MSSFSDDLDNNDQQSHFDESDPILKSDIDERYDRGDDDGMQPDFRATAREMLYQELSDPSLKTLTAERQNQIAISFFESQRKMATQIFEFNSTWAAFRYALYDSELSSIKTPPIVAYLKGVNASFEDDADEPATDFDDKNGSDEYSYAETEIYSAANLDVPASPLISAEAYQPKLPASEKLMRKINKRIRLVCKNGIWIKNEADYAALLDVVIESQNLPSAERRQFVNYLANDLNLSYVYFIKAQASRLERESIWFASASTEEKAKYLKQEGFDNEMVFNGAVRLLKATIFAANASRNMLVKTNLKAPLSMANDFSKRRARGDSIHLDLFAEGAMGLMIAADRYDPRMNVKYVTFATNWMQQRIMRHLIQHQNSVRLPCHVHSQIQSIAAAVREMMKLNPDWNEQNIPSKSDVEHYIENQKNKKTNQEMVDSTENEGNKPVKNPTLIQPNIWNLAKNKAVGISMCLSFDAAGTSNAGGPDPYVHSFMPKSDPAPTDGDEQSSIQKALISTFTYIQPHNNQPLFNDKEMFYIDLKYAKRLTVEQIQESMFEKYGMILKEVNSMGKTVKSRIIRHLKTHFPEVVEGLSLEKKKKDAMKSKDILTEMSDGGDDE